ncbi:MAG TPA: BTAD domain-containing putative transcriptional regulator [Streptosporangiaceae bacterium]
MTGFRVGGSGEPEGTMEVRLLGPVEVVAGDHHVELGPPQRRAVFAALAIDAGQLVPLRTLIGRVWDEPPDRATDSLYAHITRLRRALGEVGLAIERRSGGYVLRIERDRVDVHRFHALTRRAQRAAADRAADRAALLDRALGLWRGVPLTDVPGDWAARLRHGIEQQYVSAVAGWARLQLELGRPGHVVTELAPLVLRYPLVEPLSGMLMRGLCALGRTAEALAHYARLREHLVEQLGIEPGPELRALHQEILRGEHDRRPEPAATPGPQRTPVAGPRLTAAEGLALLRRIVGDRVDADPVGAALLVERCARQPLALRIAAELAAARPAVGLAELGDQLAAAARAWAGVDRHQLIVDAARTDRGLVGAASMSTSEPWA